MLILARAIDRKVYFGEDICVAVVSLDHLNISADLLITYQKEIGFIGQDCDRIEQKASLEKFESPKSLLVRAHQEKLLCIGNNITLKLLRLQKNQAILGFTATADIIIYRDELLEEIQKMKEQLKNTPHPASSRQTSMPAHRVQAFSPAKKTNAEGVVENSQSCEFFPTRGEVTVSPPLRE